MISILPKKKLYITDTIYAEPILFGQEATRAHMTKSFSFALITRIFLRGATERNTR